tara:strand:- start:16775 stop:16951 length:177 start_codon:yes stop_codon:yes gene_type:complete
LRNAPRIPRHRSNIDVLFVNKYALGEIRVGKVGGKKKALQMQCFLRNLMVGPNWLKAK